MDGIIELLRSLWITSESSEIERIIRALIEAGRTDMKAVVDLAVENIKRDQFDGSKWSSLALTLLDTFKGSDEPGMILKALVDKDQDNGAYLNNFGVFLEMRGWIGQAIEYYARAYATDYKYHGHEKAATFPAWTNLHRITSSYVIKPSR